MDPGFRRGDVQTPKGLLRPEVTAQLGCEIVVDTV
jgi:hypothetical protein